MDDRVIAIDQQGGKSNCGYAEDVMMTLCSDSHGTPHAVCFSIGSMNSEGMLSPNPTAGIHETTVARTIDANGSNPAGYQGGDVVVLMAIGGTDLHASITDGNTAPTMLARAGTGGGQRTYRVVNSSGEGIATVIDANYYKGQGLRQGKEREFVMIYEDLSCDNRSVVCK